MKPYDRGYFDRWYRDPRRRVTTPAELRRRAAMVVAITEQVLGRQVRSALDIGCGEGRWGSALRLLRPNIRYLGLESSEYSLRRFGLRRNIRKGTFGDLESLREKAFDLVLCVDVLHYVETRELDRGLPALAGLTGGVAHLDVTTREDEPTGDLDGWIDRPAAWYQRRFRRAGLLSAGMMCWIPESLAEHLGTLDAL